MGRVRFGVRLVRGLVSWIMKRVREGRLSCRWGAYIVHFGIVEDQWGPHVPTSLGFVGSMHMLQYPRERHTHCW